MIPVAGKSRASACVAVALLFAGTAGFASAGIAGGADAVGTPTVTPTAPSASNAGTKRFDTDEPLRKGMLQIRALVEHHHSLVTHRRLSPEMAARFMSELHNITRFIVANSTVSGEARAVVVSLAGNIDLGAEAIAGRKPEVDPIDGLFKIDEAMIEYGQRFEHPFWQSKVGK